MAVDPNEIHVAPTGRLFLADEGTPPPADLTTAWPAAWTDMGYLSEDALTMAANATTVEIMAWQSDSPVWSNVKIARTVAFQLMQWNQVNLEFVFGGGTFTEDAANGFWTYDAPPKSMFAVKALGLEAVDGDSVTRLVWHRVKVSDQGDIVFRGSDAALLDMTLQLLDNGTAEPWTMMAPMAALPLAAAGATSGNPGVFTPAGCVIPASLVALQGASPAVIAAPATAWVTGNHVVLGDAAHAHWDASAWVTGDAP
jgi:hypothetical protein